MARPELDPVVVAREQERAVDLLAAGKDYRYIAEDLGRSVATAHKRVQDGLHEARRAKAEEYLQIHLMRYEWQYDQLRQRHDSGVPIEQLSRPMNDLHAAERALLGLNAPKEIQWRGDAPRPEFADQVAFAERAADADEAAIRSGEDSEAAG